jgi:hypothetical protein
MNDQQGMQQYVRDWLAQQLAKQAPPVGRLPVGVGPDQGVNPNVIPQLGPPGGPPGLDLGGGMAWDRSRYQREPLNMQGTLQLPLPSPVSGVQPTLDVTGGYGWGQGPQPRQPLGAGNLGVRLGIKVPF